MSTNKTARNNSANDFTKEKTLVVVKPDGIQRSLVGEIITRYERIGLKLIGVKMLYPTREHVAKHYTLDPEWLRLAGEKSISSRKSREVAKAGSGPAAIESDNTKVGTMSSDPIEVGKAILEYLVGYMTAGPVIAMVWQGPHAVAIARKVTGGTEPLSSDVGTIRGDYVTDSYEMSNAQGRAIRNLIHASSSPVEAENEIAHWFAPHEIQEYLHVNESLA